VAGLSSWLLSLRVDAAIALGNGHGSTRRELPLARLAKTTPLKGADALHKWITLSPRQSCRQMRDMCRIFVVFIATP
jgi:hypothetical protein